MDRLYTKDQTAYDAGLFTGEYKRLKHNISSPRQLSVRKVDHSYANGFVLNHHYLKRKIYIARNVSYGIFLPGDMCAGVAMFGYPVWTQYPDLVPPLDIAECPELIRLCTLGGLPKNTESWFLSRCIKSMLDDWEDETGSIPKCITSFCDTAYGFNGAIYRATNFTVFRKTVGRPTNPGGRHGKWGSNKYEQKPEKTLYLYFYDRKMKSVKCDHCGISMLQTGSSGWKFIDQITLKRAYCPKCIWLDEKGQL